MDSISSNPLLAITNLENLQLKVDKARLEEEIRSLKEEVSNLHHHLQIQTEEVKKLRKERRSSESEENREKWMKYIKSINTDYLTIIPPKDYKPELMKLTLKPMKGLSDRKIYPNEESPADYGIITVYEIDRGYVLRFIITVYISWFGNRRIYTCNKFPFMSLQDLIDYISESLKYSGEGRVKFTFIVRNIFRGKVYQYIE